MQTARSVQNHLCIHTPVGLPAEHPAPSGTPSEQITETSTSSALQLTVFSPLTIRNCCLFLPAAGGADRASPHGSDFFFSAFGTLFIIDWYARSMSLSFFFCSSVREEFCPPFISCNSGSICAETPPSSELRLASRRWFCAASRNTSLRHEVNCQGQRHYQDQDDGCGDDYCLSHGVIVADTLPKLRQLGDIRRDPPRCVGPTN